MGCGAEGSGMVAARFKGGMPSSASPPPSASIAALFLTKYLGVDSRRMGDFGTRSPQHRTLPLGSGRLGRSSRSCRAAQAARVASYGTNQKPALAPCGCAGRAGTSSRPGSCTPSAGPPPRTSPCS
eukprot:scaffold43257_cov50-Phaeocystis_antarctica.AAC.1